MTKYFYLSANNEINGPFSIEELQTKQLTRETLVWAEGMTAEWKKIKNIPGLFDQIQPKTVFSSSKRECPSCGSK